MVGKAIALGPVPVGLDDSDSEALARLLAETAGLDVAFDETPHIAAMRLLADAARAHLDDFSRTAEGQILVHEAQAIRASRAIPAHATMTACGRMMRRGDGAIALSLTVSEPDQSSVVELETRLRLVEPTTLPDLRGQARPGAVPADAALSATLTAKHVERYAVLSGDSNALHLDDEMVRSAGLPACVVHGMLLVGIAEANIRAAAACWRVSETRTRFLAPVLVGERVRTGLSERGSSAGGRRLFRASVWAQDGVLACVSDAVIVPL